VGKRLAELPRHVPVAGGAELFGLGLEELALPGTVHRMASVAGHRRPEVGVPLGVHEPFPCAVAGKALAGAAGSLGDLDETRVTGSGVLAPVPVATLAHLRPLFPGERVGVAGERLGQVVVAAVAGGERLLGTYQRH